MKVIEVDLGDRSFNLRALGQSQHRRQCTHAEAHVEIGWDPKFADHVPWTVAELIARQDFDSPRIVRDKSKEAYILVVRPRDPDLVESVAGAAFSRWYDRDGVREMAASRTTAARAEALAGKLTAAGIRAQIRRP